MASPPRRPTAPSASGLLAYRIADARFPIYDGTGASLVGGRWNSAGRPVIYAALTFAGAMLERLAHAGASRLPRRQRLVVIRIPGRVAVERLTLRQLPTGWDAPDCEAARRFGDSWLAEGRSAVLLVPSVVAKYEWNVAINPRHAHAKWIRVSDPEEVRWDPRLFGG